MTDFTNGSFSSAIDAAPALLQAGRSMATGLYRAATNQPLAAAAGAVVGATCILGAVKAIELSAPTVRTVIGSAAFAAHVGAENISVTVRGWFSRTERVA